MSSTAHAICPISNFDSISVGGHFTISYCFGCIRWSLFNLKNSVGSISSSLTANTKTKSLPHMKAIDCMLRFSSPNGGDGPLGERAIV
jgi:hypothetical protein